MTSEDIAAIVELVRAEDVAVRGRTDFSREQFEQLVLADSTLDRDRDVVVAERDGAVIGAGVVTRRSANIGVHPDARDASLRGELLVWAEDRQRERGRDRLAVATYAQHREQVNLLLSAGYSLERFYALMVVSFDLTGPPEPAVVPAGYRVELIDADADAAALHTLDERAFGDRPDHLPQTLEDFTNSHLRFAEFEPAWSLIARTQAGQPAGLLIGWRPVDHPHGYIALLGVDPEHRRQGLARALLLSAFGVIVGAGLPTAELHVASDNPRALDLYTGVGMVDHERFEHYTRGA